jgi:uncharacterized protein (TIGR02444 family)
MTAWPDEPFWTYSLELYGRPGVEAACLELQRRHGLDVNLVLLCCWLASRGIELDQITLARAKKAITSWQLEVVRPLRALRRRLGVKLLHPERHSIPALWGELAAGLRGRVLAVELDAEHLAQLALGRVVAELQAGGAAGPGLAIANLCRYWAFEQHDLQALRSLLRAAMPNATAEALAEALAAVGG